MNNFFTSQQKKILIRQLHPVRKDNIIQAEANWQEFPIRKMHLIIDNRDSVQNGPIRAYRLSVG